MRSKPSSRRSTRRLLKRGSVQSIVDLQAAIHRSIAEYAGLKSFTWTKTADEILAKLSAAAIALIARVHTP